MAGELTVSRKSRIPNMAHATAHPTADAHLR